MVDVSRRRLPVDGIRALDVVEFGDTGRGPRAVVLGGVHGDELEGVTVARQLVAVLEDVLRRSPGALLGSVQVVPVANPDAFDAGTRTSPSDGGNLARAFPGAPAGSYTERVADVLTRELIAGASLLVDLHSAGRHYAMPVFAGCVDAGPVGARSREACLAFGSPTSWIHLTSNPGRSLSAASDLAVPSIYVEGSGGGGLCGDDLDVYLRGVRNVLAWVGAVDPVAIGATVPAGPARLLVGGDGDTDASLAALDDGWFVTRSSPGAAVRSGDLLGELLDGGGRVQAAITAPADGTLMMLRRTAEVRAGDGLAMVGPPVREEQR
ncbi:succinylglutamate desuccinylase/aspartoacylase family protein [Desertimonas flava]|uniref:succinylglutamate desuccinylase/aspartoacylase family protein n=1 Tax=Desertimonas flava TaxID=2064846 RepID=UPI000E348CEB|nr:M14 family metallopeptidase [Desertimonas flava]